MLKFDDLKMSNPAIQNDFSYYRRTLSRMKMNNTGGEDQAVVTNEEANRMSLFYAYPTPILKTISDATTKFVSDVSAIVVVVEIELELERATVGQWVVENGRPT